MQYSLIQKVRSGCYGPTFVTYNLDEFRFMVQEKISKHIKMAAKHGSLNTGSFVAFFPEPKK